MVDLSFRKRVTLSIKIIAVAQIAKIIIEFNPRENYYVIPFLQIPLQVLFFDFAIRPFEFKKKFRYKTNALKRDIL